MRDGNKYIKKRYEHYLLILLLILPVSPPMRTIVFESKATDEKSLRPLQLAEEVTRDQLDPLSILLHTSFKKSVHYIIKRQGRKYEKEG